MAITLFSSKTGGKVCHRNQNLSDEGTMMAEQVKVESNCEDCNIEFVSMEFKGVSPQPKCPACLDLFEQSLIDSTEYTEYPES